MKKPFTQRDRGYTNLLHHMSKNDTKQNQHNQKIERLLKQIMATQDEAAAQLEAVNSELQKIGTETQTLLDKITALENATPADVSPALQSAIDAVVAQAKVVDDLVPDPASGKRKHGK